MLTLDEAVAKYREARDRMPDATYAGGRWLIDAKEALDAAVRNVALAAVDDLVQRRRAKGLPTQFALPDTKAEIDRLLGPEKAGA
jgi:hypothetical protein